MSWSRLEMPGFKQPMVLVTKEVPTAPPGGIVLQVKYAGICHSDVHIWDGEMFNIPQFTFPRVLGHETAGVVHSIGEKTVTDLKVGDRAAVYPWGHCGECDFCHHDNQFCPKFVMIEADPKLDQQKVYGIWQDGGYQSHIIVHDASLVVRVPENVGLDVASLACCGGITSYTAVKSLQLSIHDAIRMKGHAKVVMVGAGGLCLWGILICRALYPDNVSICVVSTHEEKLKDAKDAGAHATLCWDKNPEKSNEAVKALTEAIGGRFDAAIDYIGSSATVERLFEASDTCASITVVGLFGGAMPPIPLQGFSLRGVRLQGSYVGNRSSLHEVLSLLQQGKMKAPKMEYVKLEEVNDVISRLREGKQRGRAVVKMD